ncbi:diguanylate cyclase [Sulfuricurvum sp.]|uniref:diguanylate cyclase n=1 Tax=Sulfuricurvum sp. TaxID=2025608 RepID=UPI00286E6F35|nr:diguanylate cyclase [Sulfuricurvum sp.]
MSFKRRIQVSITVLIFVVSTILTSYFIYHEEQIAAEKAFHSSQNIKRVYDSIRKDLESFYIYRAYANLRSAGVKEAMDARDQEKLYELTLPRYTTLREENPHLIVMQFHAPDGRSILRMHRKEVFGDDIAARRPMLKKTHATRSVHCGFEGGIEGIGYRIVVPFSDKDKYVGALEFGIDPDVIISKLVQTTKMETLFMLHESRMAAADTQKYQARYSGYLFSHLTPYQKPLIEEFVKENQDLNQRIIHYQGKKYDVIPIYLNGNDGKPIGIFLCFNDVTRGFQEVSEVILESFMLTLSMIIILLGIFEYAFARMTKKMVFQETYTSTILNSQKNIIVVMDNGEIIYANNAFFDYFHYRSLEEFRQNNRCICELFEKSETETYIQPEMNGMGWAEYLLENKDRENRVRMTINGVTSTFTVDVQKMEYEEVLRYVVVFNDITNLNNLATLDRLTQIANRFEFDKILGHSIDVARRYERSFSIILLDIDHFKSVNDHFGHLVGDEVLKTFSELLRKQIRQSDVVARWGGEEFIILLPDTSLPSAIKMADALRQRIEVNPFETVGNITCSIGVAEFNLADKADDLLHRADQKLYRAKNSGRNRVMA